MTCTTVRRAAGSLGRPWAATTRRRISAWRAPRPGRRRGGRARVVVVSVVVARPVVRHTRPTADCRPAASGPFVSRSSSCACSPCGDPQTSGGSLPLRWSLALGWLLPLRWSLPSGGWPRSGGEWRLVRASPSRLSRRGSAPRRPVGARARRRVLTGRARRASGRRTGAARVSLGGSGLLRHAAGEAGGAPRPPLNRRCTAALPPRYRRADRAV